MFYFREFTMAEIEHFCDPNDKKHAKFNSVKHTTVKLYSACNQMDGKPAETMTMGEAVEKVCDTPVSYTHLDVYKRQG